MSVMLLKGRMVDVVRAKEIEQAAVLVEDNKILYAGEANGCPEVPADEVIDAGRGTILPGFMDVHAHLTGSEDAGSFGNGAMLGDQIVGAVYQAGLLLDAGFTGLRDMSEAGLYVSRGVERGVIRGPRIVPGGKVLGITSGHVDFCPHQTIEYYNANDHLSCCCDGVDGCIRAVREQFRIGAKFIKICATGGVSSPTDRIDDVQFSPEELRAMVAEAHRHHSYVTAHCTGYEGAYQALLAGVECIEHGVFLTQREIDLMAEKHVPLVSTLAVALGVANIPGLPDWMHKKAVDCAQANINTIAMARKAGLCIALGTDFSNSRNTPYLENGSEFRAMMKAGMTNMEALQAGTINAAKVMRMEDTIGSLEAGKLADVVIVDGNPLTDIECLTHADHVQLVLKDGKVEKRTL
ncbi:MAG: amidohydrolase family protein [Aristaeellaceae bacterium]